VDRLFNLPPEGTVYLDEITDIPPAYQRDLLPLLKGTNPFFILSTRTDPKESVKKGLLLPELYRLLASSEVRIPPLRERREDIAPLVQKFMRELSDERGLHRGIKKAAMGILVEYDWPGNVHELKLEVERAVLSSQTSVSPTDLSPAVLGQSGFLPGSFKKDAPELQDQRAQFERDYILQALEGAGNNKIRAAKKLGLSRAMLYVKLKKYKIPLR
jgi:DNA-binding NtrC family response regulator